MRSYIPGLLKLFAENIVEKWTEIGDAYTESGYDKESGSEEERKEKQPNRFNESSITNQDKETISASCDGILEFLQAVTENSQKVVPNPPLLISDKCVRKWMWV